MIWMRSSPDAFDDAVGIGMLVCGLFALVLGPSVIDVLDGQVEWWSHRVIMREIRRRTRVVGAFPDGNSANNLAAARLRHLAGTRWSTGQPNDI